MKNVKKKKTGSLGWIGVVVLGKKNDFFSFLVWINVNSMEDKDCPEGKELFFTNTKVYYIDEEKKLYPLDNPDFIVRSRYETKMALENGISKIDFVKNMKDLMEQFVLIIGREKRIIKMKEIFDLIFKYQAFLNHYPKFKTTVRLRLIHFTTEEGWDGAQEYFKKLFPEDTLSLFM